MVKSYRNAAIKCSL